jgi:hypothetical protein
MDDELRKEIGEIVETEWNMRDPTAKLAFARSVIFPLFEDLFLSRNITDERSNLDVILVKKVVYVMKDEEYGGYIPDDKKGDMFGRIIGHSSAWLSVERRCGVSVCLSLFWTLHSYWIDDCVYREAGMRWIMRGLGEKNERINFVLLSKSTGIQRTLEEFEKRKKGKERKRILMWMIEKEGGIENLILLCFHEVKEIRSLAKGGVGKVGIVI